MGFGLCLALFLLPAPSRAAPEAPMPMPPALADVIAVEVEKGSGRRLTRDAPSVRTVLDALGAQESWASAGTPRCKTQLWARLVPASGEGGASFLFCDASSPGYLSVPELGSFRLPEEASRALHAATSQLALPEVGSIAPVVVTEHLDTLLVRITTDPGPSAANGLRSVTLARGHRLEPDATWADGTPVSRSFTLSETQASDIARALAVSGFFGRADAFASAATEAPGAPPAARTLGTPPSLPAPTAWVSVTVTSGDWHHAWHEAKASAIFVHTVAHLSRVDVGDEARAALGALQPR